MKQIRSQYIVVEIYLRRLIVITRFNIAQDSSFSFDWLVAATLTIFFIFKEGRI